MNAVSRGLLERVAGNDDGMMAPVDGRKEFDRDGGTRRRRVEKRAPRRATEAERAPGARFERLEKIRAAVFERAAGRCEAWFESAGLLERCGREPAVMDRLESPGCGPQQETADTCWALCVECSRERIANHRDAARWHRSFELHRKANHERFTSRNGGGMARGWTQPTRNASAPDPPRPRGIQGA